MQGRHQSRQGLIDIFEFKMKKIKHHGIIIKKVGALTGRTKLRIEVFNDVCQVRRFEQQSHQWQLSAFDFKGLCHETGIKNNEKKTG